jgi:hypothetical protein
VALISSSNTSRSASRSPVTNALQAIDETPERRRGNGITAMGVYQNLVRSCRERFVKNEQPEMNLVCLILYLLSESSSQRP